LPVVGAGPSREPSHRAFPKIIEDWDIARIVEDYADAAERMKEAGLDGVEFECYGHLMDQFVSPLTNALAHPYGGSLENRLRFAMDVLEACRKRVGPGFLLGVRYTADEEEKGGISVEEGLEMAHRFKASGLVDFLNIIRGRIHTDAALTGVIPSRACARPRISISRG
jgi:N-methyl-L-proline demethylase